MAEGRGRRGLYADFMYRTEFLSIPGTKPTRASRIVLRRHAPTPARARSIRSRLEQRQYRQQTQTYIIRLSTELAFLLGTPETHNKTAPSLPPTHLPKTEAQVSWMTYIGQPRRPDFHKQETTCGLVWTHPSRVNSRKFWSETRMWKKCGLLTFLGGLQ